MASKVNGPSPINATASTPKSANAMHKPISKSAQTEPPSECDTLLTSFAPLEDPRQLPFANGGSAFGNRFSSSVSLSAALANEARPRYASKPSPSQGKPASTPFQHSLPDTAELDETMQQGRPQISLNRYGLPTSSYNPSWVQE